MMTIEQINIAFNKGKIPFKLVNKNNYKYIIYRFGSSKEFMEKRFLKNWNIYEVSINDFKLNYFNRIVINELMKFHVIQICSIVYNQIKFEYKLTIGQYKIITLIINFPELHFKTEKLNLKYTMSDTNKFTTEIKKCITNFLKLI